MVDFLIFRTWWSYRPGEIPWVYAPYHVFNLFEGCAWLAFAGAVFLRYVKNRKSIFELWYSLAFLTFGLTDFKEAYALSSWLIWLKLANLFLIVRLRSRLIRDYYPSSKLF